jgi:tRNA(Ile)-lysidine synthase
MSFPLVYSDLPFIPRRIFIAFSGGLDSRVLLDVLMHSAWIKENAIQLILVNVNHHTDPSEADLSQFAAEIAEQYQLTAHLLHVKTSCPKGESLEAFMRHERYQLLRSLLAPTDILVTGHHLDDQAETFLLNLMRGSGLQGLSGMAAVRKEGENYLWRPLLTYAKKELLAYAQAKALTWLEDPTNRNGALDRIFLRTEILPQLSVRWPQVKDLLARTAHNIRGAQEVLHGYLQQDLAELIDKEGSLDLKKLEKFPEAHGVLLLKTYLDQFNYRLGSKQLRQIYQDFVLTENDAEPVFVYREGELRRAKRRLYFKRLNSKT